MQDRSNSYSIHLYRVVDEVREPTEPSSAKWTNPEWKRIWHADNPPQNSLGFYKEAKSQIRIYV